MHEREHNESTRKETKRNTITTKKEKEKAPTNKQTNKLDDGQPSRASEQQTEGRPQKQLLHWKEKHKHARTHARTQTGKKTVLVQMTMYTTRAHIQQQRHSSHDARTPTELI
jgi:hypothetical protein